MAGVIDLIDWRIKHSLNSFWTFTLNLGGVLCSTSSLVRKHKFVDYYPFYKYTMTVVPLEQRQLELAAHEGHHRQRISSAPFELHLVA